MLRPTMLRYVALTCCDRFAGALGSARAYDMGHLFLVLEQIAKSGQNLSARIHTQIRGSRVDVVRLRDQMARVARFSCGVFAVIVGNENQDAYM